MDESAPISSLTFTAFDFETTGLTAGMDRIVEIGAVKFRNREVLATFTRLINPGMVISEAASAINGITNAMVDPHPPIHEVLPSLIEFTEGSILVAHNAQFDLGFLRAALLDAGLGDVRNVVVDTQVLAKRAFPGQKSYALQNLAVFLKFPANNAHRALDDAQMCMRLFQSCSEALSFMGEITLEEILT